MTGSDYSVLSPYERAGMDWWNTLDEAMRRYWCDMAQSSVPAVAYSAYLAYQEDRRNGFYRQGGDGGFDA